MTIQYPTEKRLKHGDKVVVLGTFQVGHIKRIWSSNLYDVGAADVMVGEKLRRDEIEDFDVWCKTVHEAKE